MINPITFYFHCAQCLEELPADTSPKEWSRIQVGLGEDPDQIVVWCNRHDKEVATFTLEVPMPRELLECEFCNHEDETIN